MKTNALALVAVMLMLAACTTVYRAVVTLTQVVDSAAVEYARLYNDGLVPTELATRVAAAHLNFRLAAGIARDAFVAYKNGTAPSPEQYNVAFTAAQQTARDFVGLVTPLLPPHQSIALQQRLREANEP